MDIEFSILLRLACVSIFLALATFVTESQGKVSVLDGPGYRILQVRATRGCNADSIRNKIYHSCLYKRDEIERAHAFNFAPSENMEPAHRIYTTNEEEAMLRDILWPASAAHHDVPASTRINPKYDARGSQPQLGHHDSLSQHYKSAHRRSLVSKYKGSAELEPKRDLREIIAKCCRGPCSDKDFAPYCRDID